MAAAAPLPSSSVVTGITALHFLGAWRDVARATSSSGDTGDLGNGVWPPLGLLPPPPRPVSPGSGDGVVCWKTGR